MSYHAIGAKFLVHHAIKAIVSLIFNCISEELPLALGLKPMTLELETTVLQQGWKLLLLGIQNSSWRRTSQLMSATEL